MKNLERHIARLVATHNCVILPGFGAFLGHSVSAYYNVKEQLFMPPHRTLGFNPQITIDDSLLVSDYMSSEKVSYETAANMVQHDIKNLRNMLLRKGSLRFGELGTFFMDINEQITFEPEKNCIDDAYNYGLEPLAIKQLHMQQEKVIVIKRRELKKYIVAVAAIILTFLFVTPVSDQMFNDNLKASLSGFASSEHISLMQQFSASAPAQVNNIAECEITPVDFSKNTTTAPAKEITETKKSVAMQKIAPIAKKSSNITEATTPKHYIIVASCPSAENAQLAISELSAKKTAEYTVVKCGKRYRIAINNYSTASDAQNALQEYHGTFPDAWVLTY